MPTGKTQLYLIAILLLTTFGCSDSIDIMATAHLVPTYEFGFVSVATFDLSDVGLYMERDHQRVQIAPAGFIGAKSDDPGGWGKWGKTGHFASAPARIPDKVFLSWFDHRGEQEQTISLSGIVPDMNDFDGTIWFVFDGDKWRVSTLTKEQTWWRVTHEKGETPIN